MPGEDCLTKRRSHAVVLFRKEKNTCNNNRVGPGRSKFQCHLMLVFVYSQVVLIGKPLEQVEKRGITRSSRWVIV